MANLAFQVTDVLMFNSARELKWDTRPMGSVSVTAVFRQNGQSENKSTSRSFRQGAEMLTDALIEEMPSVETAWEDAYLESGIVGSGEKALKELESWKMEVEESMCDGVRAFKELLNRHPDIEAVVCASDNLAAGILMAVGSAKIRGCTLTLENFCVTGFDDSEVAKAMKFTSVKQPLAKIAELTVSSLVDKIEGKTPSKDETKTHLIKPEIIWRNTFANMT